MFPLCEKAQDLDLAITVYVASDLRLARRDPAGLMHNGVLVLPGASYAVLWGLLADRFPRLRWAFVVITRTRKAQLVTLRLAPLLS
jgi:hypothetical protein